ncbi:MAG: leucine-rich repeat protein [Methanomethylophilus alvi]
MHSEEVVIEDGVTSIGNYAFEGCSSLASVTIPDGVVSICYSVFEKCTSLVSVTIPDGVASIDHRAFYGCSSLTSIILPDSVTSIGDYAFFKCTNVSSIRLGPDVSSIGYRAFEGNVFYDRDAVSVLSADANSLKGGCFVKTDDRMVKVDGHMMSFYVDGKVVYRGVFVEGDEDTHIPDVPFRPGYICSWEEFELGTEDISVNAVYVLRELTVSFDPNGGSGSMDPVTTDVEHLFLRPENGFSAPDHMHFAGWAYSSDGEPIDFDGLRMADDAVLYALWAWDQYDVVYKVDGETVFTDTFGYGTEVTVRDMFQKTGYTVTGWSTDDAEVSDGKFVLRASDVVFTASSSINRYSYAVEFVDESGNSVAEKVSGTEYCGSTVDTVIKDVVGYTAPSEAVKVFVSEDESKNVVRYVYKIIFYTITFDDGTVQTDVKYTVKDSSVDEPMVTKKKGYAGVWEEYVLDLTDKTVKAVYTAESYHVEFVSDGIVFFAYGLEYGKEITLPSGTPSKDADVRYVYTFSGWDGYTEDMTVDGDITFVAVFFRTVPTLQ